MSSVEGSSVTVTLYLRAQMNFYSHIPCFFTDMDEILCTRSPWSYVEHLCATWKL